MSNSPTPRVAPVSGPLFAPSATIEARPHPAPYTVSLLPVFARLIPPGPQIVLDPMAGTGRIFDLLHWRPDLTIHAIELEPEFAAHDPRTRVGNALALPFLAASVDVICVSPAYGNRMADHHEAKDASERITYRHKLARPLHPDNGGGLQWGDAYRDLHRRAWAEADRVLRPGGRFILNCKDHIREGVRQEVSAWHAGVLAFDLDYTQIASVRVPAPGMRRGKNWEARVDSEDVWCYQKPGAQP